MTAMYIIIMWYFLARVYNIRAGKRSAQIFSYDRRRCVRWIEKIEKFRLYRLQWICDNFASKAYKFTCMLHVYSGNTKHFEYYWRQKYIYLSGIFSFKNNQNLLWYVKGNIHVYLKKKNICLYEVCACNLRFVSLWYL